jgi:hypothetical protein
MMAEAQPVQPIARQDQRQEIAEYDTDDAKTMVVEKIQCTNQYEGSRWPLIVEHDGMDPQTLASTYFEQAEIEDILHKLHNDHRIKHFFYSPRMRHMFRYQSQIAEENYLEAKARQSKQGFLTRQVTGPAIRSASTSSTQGEAQQKKWYRRLI